MNKSDAGKLGAIKSKLTKRIQKAERISLYDLSPVRCKFCHKALSYAQRRNTFCDHVCAASHNNVRVVRNFVSGDRVKKICPTCKAETTNAIFCSTKCNHAHNWQKTKQMIESCGRLLPVNSGYGYNPHVAKRYLIETRGHQCAICGGDIWHGKPMPLILDHINGDPEDHRLENLRLVCGNCNMQLPTFAGKNRGKGRKSRGSYAFVPHL